MVPLILAYYYELMYEIDRVDPCLAASHCKYCMWKPAMQAQFLQSGFWILSAFLMWARNCKISLKSNKKGGIVYCVCYTIYIINAKNQLYLNFLFSSLRMLALFTDFSPLTAVNLNCIELNSSRVAIGANQVWKTCKFYVLEHKFFGNMGLFNFTNLQQKWVWN